MKTKKDETDKLPEIGGKKARFFQIFKKNFHTIADFYSFKEAELPIIENTSLFEKTLAPAPSFFEKEIISFRVGNSRMALRPEWFSQAVKMYLGESGEYSGKLAKLWFFGPFFRRGKILQDNKIGIEVIGADSWVSDVQIMQILVDVIKESGVGDVLVRINNIGDSQCQPGYKKALSAFLKKNKSRLCPLCQEKVKAEPLKVFSCGDSNCREAARNGAPQIVDYLCRECHSNLKNVLEGLEGLEIPYILDPYLFGEFNYYTKTVFEIVAGEDIDDQEENPVLAYGGRHNNIFKPLIGEEAPAVGGIINLENIFNIVDGSLKKRQSQQSANVFLAQVGIHSKIKAMKLLEILRKEKIKVAELIIKDSLSAQLKRAERLKIKNVLILGEKEAIEDSIILRNTETGKQKTVPLKNIVKEIKKIK